MNGLSREQIEHKIIRDMNEGVIVIHDSGKMLVMNKAAELILEKTEEELNAESFASLLNNEEQTDAFHQIISETIAKQEDIYNKIIPYHGKTKRKYLNITASRLHDNEDYEKVRGVVVVLSDFTELVSVRRNLQFMHEIKLLNKQLSEKNAFIRNAFSRFLSDEIVEQILDKPDGLAIGGEKKNITVMMSDLRGFTALCEELDSAMVMDMLNFYLNRMVAIIKKHNGTIIEYLGDGILSIFGAPISSETHPVDAVLAALEMQEAMKDINKANLENGYPRLSMGIGINTGDAVVGNMGSENSIKYNLIGRCVNMCGRIEGYTVAGQVFISPYTKERIPYELRLDDQFEIRPKGLSESLMISSVRGIGEPYNIFIEYDTIPLSKVKEPLRVRLYHMDGKHIPKTYSHAEILEYSSKQILIKTDDELNVRDDIMVRNRYDIYGKVIRITDEKHYLIEVTGRAKRV